MTSHPATLTEVLAELATKIRRYQDKPIGEQNTKASLIEPLLECLGWDIRDLDSVHREYRTKSRDNPVDYALMMLRRPRLFIEAKSLGENLAERKWVSQVLGYAAVAGVEWCVLTDGNEYRIYNATAAVDAEEKLFRRVRVAEDSPEVVGATLVLVTRANLEENLLDVHWKMHFVDRRCREALKTMIASSDSGLVRLIRKAVDGLSAADVKESLARLEVKIESPPMPLGSPPVAQRQGRSVSRRVEASANESSDRSAVVEDGSRERIGVSLAQVIGAGLLKAPVCLFRKYKGQRMEAALLADGTVRFNGEAFDSCSRAAEQARSTITGRRMNTNGWTFWQYDDNGVTRQLDYARQRFLQLQLAIPDPTGKYESTAGAA